jgi:hypothetical protein
MASRLSLALVLISALAGPAAAADLAALRQARSLVAEAGAVEQQARAGGLTKAYAAQMREEARRQLQSARVKAARSSPELAAPIGEALHALDAHDAAALKAIAQRLFAMEGAHGRAD